MRIIIESNVSKDQNEIKSIVEVPYDDVTCTEVVRLFRQALMGYGFHPATVKDCLPEEE